MLTRIFLADGKLARIARRTLDWHLPHFIPSIDSFTVAPFPLTTIGALNEVVVSEFNSTPVFSTHSALREKAMTKQIVTNTFFTGAAYSSIRKCSTKKNKKLSGQFAHRAFLNFTESYLIIRI